jgi:hypothetical protein
VRGILVFILICCCENSIKFYPEKQEGSEEETWRLLNDPSLEGQTAQYNQSKITTKEAIS